MSRWGTKIDQLFQAAGAEPISLSSLAQAYDRGVEKVAAQQSKASVQSELEDLNSKVTIETNPVVRLRKHIAQFNAKLNKLSADITDDTGHTRTINGSEQDSVKLKDPKWLPRPAITTHEATARHGNKDVKLSLEIRV